jgi:acyl transferase domain-containing protein
VKRAVLVLPGRGSYSEASLGGIDRDAPLTRAAEALRASLELESIVALDRAARYMPARHARPANAAVLIFLRAMQDVARALAERRVVCVVGNSMGWYTALAAAGALAAEDALLLVQRMALLQEQGAAGGQVIHPLVDEKWNRVPERAAAVERALATHAGEVFRSIELGGYTVLAGTEAGVRALLSELAPVTQSHTSYPFRLAQHGPYHTPLADEVSRRALELFAGLPLRRPTLPLVDGRGRPWSPWSSDPEALREYTLATQVTTPYDFTSSVRVALREWAPDELVLTGPGNTLGGVCGQILVAEGWRSIRSRADFDRVQASESPVLWSMER